jgi:RNA polymerase sigma-B factor
VLAVTGATERLASRDGRAPSAQQVAAELQMDLEDVLEALQAGRAYAASSLQAPLDLEGGTATLSDTVGGDDPRLARAEEMAMLARARGVLDETELEVLRLRFVDDLTQSEIARRVGCSQMQVSRILRRSLDRLASAVERPRAPLLREPAPTRALAASAR